MGKKSNKKKCCTECKTTETPQWRGGPAGPQSLCNACGIKYMKRGREMLCLNKGSEKKKGRSQSTTTTTSASMAISFSMLEAPGGGIHGLANFCWESFHNLSGSHGSSFQMFASETYGFEGGCSRRGSKMPITTKTEGRNKTKKTAKPRKLVREILDEKVSTRSAKTSKKKKISEHQQLRYCGIQQMIAENKDLANLVTVIVYDTETTGLSRKEDRIIEIALQDLSGGKNSTFQTLVDPGCFVDNSHVHGITTDMVCRPDVPRMEELIPILLKFVKSRQKPRGYVLLAGHNSSAFDLPFLINEFSRCSYEIPSNWLFLDTLSLARELIKSGGLSLSLSLL
ncbi:hypothetical protein PTKIN_Ptkin01aG0310500 [Pterospermum kingtungense]